MSDYFEDDQAERLKQWWDDNGTMLIIGLVAVIASVFGWRYYQDYAASERAAASDAYRDYIEARSLEQPGEAELAEIEQKFADSSYRVLVLLHRARDEAEAENWQAARDLLVQTVELADLPLLQDIARFRMAQIDYQTDALDQALTTLEGIRSSGLAVEVAELTGDIHVAKGDLEAAKAAYEVGIERAEEAAERIPGGSGLLQLKLASLVDESGE